MLTAEEWRERIVVDPGVFSRETDRKGDEAIGRVHCGLLGNGWTVETILENHPQLKREDIAAVLKYILFHEHVLGG